MVQLVESVLFNVDVFDLLLTDDVSLVEDLDGVIAPVRKIDRCYDLFGNNEGRKGVEARRVKRRCQ